MHTHDTSPQPTMDGQVRAWLRLEGLAALIAGVVIYSRLGADLIWFVPALLAVDISAAGYLRGPRAGALTYNLFHNWATGLVVLGAGTCGQRAPGRDGRRGAHRARGHGPHGRLRPEADDQLPGHPPGSHRQAPAGSRAGHGHPTVLVG